MEEITLKILQNSQVLIILEPFLLDVYFVAPSKFTCIYMPLFFTLFLLSYVRSNCFFQKIQIRNYLKWLLLEI